MMTEKKKELTTINKTNETISDQVLSWAKTVEMQREERAILATTKY